MHPRVLAALSRPVVGHLDPRFVDMMVELQAMLRSAFRTDNALTFPLSAPGSAGMEACLVNLVEPGDTVVVCVNGFFGGRMQAIVERCGGQAVLLRTPWGEPVPPASLDALLHDTPSASVVAFVHAETSTGALSDAAALAAVAQRHGCLTVVDAVTSLGGVPLEVDAWGLDAVYSGSQKCLSATPGISPVTFSPRALARVESRKTPVQSWFLDITNLRRYWAPDGKRGYHHTAPVHSLYSLHEALVMLHEEGLEAVHARHRDLHEHLAAGLADLGMSFVCAPAHRLPQLNAVWVPEAVDEAAVRRALLERYSIEIGGGLGDLAGKAWRIGLMGAAASPAHVTLLIGALRELLPTD
jgi:alanine-glyoxylate transaminase/serine-glyoxylate transaminase/serine-pyruvate transaminase